jgi:hypothetical protein
MYGVEAATGLGGLAAQAPGGNQFLPQALRISSVRSGMIGGPVVGGSSVLPQSFNAPAGSGFGPQISSDGTSVEQSPGLSLGSWRDVLDWHNSAAPWVLVGILIIYGWTHVSFRARGAADLGLGRA